NCFPELGLALVFGPRVVDVREHAAWSAEDTVFELETLVEADVVLNLTVAAHANVRSDHHVLTDRAVLTDVAVFQDVHEMPDARPAPDPRRLVNIGTFVNESAVRPASHVGSAPRRCGPWRASDAARPCLARSARA